jgi:hypothetical protein
MGSSKKHKEKDKDRVKEKKAHKKKQSEGEEKERSHKKKHKEKRKHDTPASGEGKIPSHRMYMLCSRVQLKTECGVLATTVQGPTHPNPKCEMSKVTSSTASVNFVSPRTRPGVPR